MEGEGTGHSGHGAWSDVSDYVVHLTRGERDDAYENIMGILSGHKLLPGPDPFGCARGIPEVRESQRSVCFSEIPLDRLGRLEDRRSKYGIGFSKKFAITNQTHPVWYVENGSELQRHIRSIVDRAQAEGDWEHPIWKATPFVDFPGDYHGGAYRFEWEREWRHVGEFRFAMSDVAFLFVPEYLHEKARRFFEDLSHEHGGPIYLCPYLDPAWTDERIRIAFRDGASGIQ